MNSISSLSTENCQGLFLMKHLLLRAFIKTPSNSPLFLTLPYSLLEYPVKIHHFLLSSGTQTEKFYFL
ncbi:hypothetical protein U27_04794 [Candidatus Vecturithrix granuli]|uniref:Uncharacterized protein n=1 Tax=Vecturithrix granuli TaxID=1499967 RepID=A0A081BZS2_VECG1|nr:hypothetical protein U27_04794 [Candidatus Vecturithrix granuli]